MNLYKLNAEAERHWILQNTRPNRTVLETVLRKTAFCKGPSYVYQSEKRTRVKDRPLSLAVTPVKLSTVASRPFRVVRPRIWNEWPDGRCDVCWVVAVDISPAHWQLICLLNHFLTLSCRTPLTSH